MAQAFVNDYTSNFFEILQTIDCVNDLGMIFNFSGKYQLKSSHFQFFLTTYFIFVKSCN